MAPGGYSAKGYFAMQKFDNFGPSTLSHNTLTFGEILGQDACTEPGNVLPALFDTAKVCDSSCFQRLVPRLFHHISRVF